MTNKVNTKQTDYGALLMDKCDACGQESNWHLVSIAEDFKILGKKMFTKKTDYALLCCECGYGMALQKSMFDKLKDLAVIKKNQTAKVSV